jgi:chemotaxis protein histidine kinase CheA
MRVKKSVIIAIICVVLPIMTGCEALVRKFTRKPKKDQLPKEELVLMPQEYVPPKLSKEELYQQYFLFWKSWQDELVNALIENNTNQKKQISCAQEALKNLTQMTALLSAAQQKKIAVYVSQLDELATSIQNDIYGNRMVSHRQAAERLLRDILKDFSFEKIKGSLL